MKKTLLLIASAALLLVGCAKEELGPDAGSGEMVTANFTAQMQGMPQTKSVTDGEGTKANRCVMEIYYEGVLYTRDVQPIEGKKATFTPRLVSNRTYDVLFWADCGEGLADKYYTTNAEGLGLQAVEMKSTSYAANDDARDAFYTKDTVLVRQQVSSETFELTRPFAQVNIITTDAAIIKNANLYPDGVKMVYTAPTKFNLLTKTLSEEKKLTVTGTPYENFDAGSSALTLEMDYLFAILDKSALDIAFEASKTGEATTTHSFTNIPVQRNFRTNIKGALLTTTGNWVAEIVDTWNGAKEEKVVEAGSVAAANEAFANGATNVKITSVGEETTLYLPQTTKEVTIDFANPDKDVTVKYGPAPDASPATKAAVADKPAVVNIATNDVTKFTVTDISNLVWLAGNQAALANALANAAKTHTVALSNDITMTGNWVSVKRWDNTPNFDGRNHVISNMTITTEEDAYVGLFSQIANRVTIQNVTFRNAKLLIPESVGEHARGGVLVGHAYPINVYNCHVEGATIVGCQELGGLIGSVEGDAANSTVTIKDCSVKDVNISSNRTNNYLEHGVGGFIGHVSLSQADLITIENNSIENVTITGNKPMDNYSTDVFMQLVPHVFIGNACNNCSCGTAAVGDHKIVLKNNKILGTNTILPTCIYSSEYFGWAGNAEERPAWKGGILIDGQEWTPNYPVQIVGDKKYATLDAALAAATAGQTVQILKAGDYTVQTLSTNAAVVEATVGGVVFNHTPKSGENQNWVSAQTDNVKTVKNITWNVGNGGHYPYFSNTNLENCTVNGMLCTHLTNKFKDCTFINEEGYNFWVYGNEYTEFDNCTFTCPGKNDGVSGCGSALNCYNEAAQTPTPVLVVKNCTFTAKEASNKYSALYIKPETAFDIRITNSTCNDNFCTGAISGSKLWNLKSDREGTTVTIDGNMVYPFSMDADGNYSVSNVFGLKMAIKHWNALKVSGEKSITLADGTYNVSDMAIFQNYANKSLLIKAENKKQAVITPPTGSKQLIFVVAGMSKSYAGHITVDGIKFDFSNASDKTKESDVISISDAVGTNLPDDEKALYSGTYHYAHDITVKNCEIIGLGIDNEHSSVVRTENQNGYNVKVQNCVIDKVGYVLTSKITTLAEVSDCTITDSKCVINNSTDQTEYKIIGNTISTYNNYCVRVQYGPIEVKDNNFNITWTPETGEYPTKHEPGVIALINSTGNEATITENTFNKATDTMYDVYCKTSWIVNGETIPADTGKNF